MKVITIIAVMLCVSCYDDTNRISYDEVYDDSLRARKDDQRLDLCRVSDKRTDKKIMFTGDSRTWGLKTESLPYTTYNHARGGTTTIGGILRMNNINMYDYNYIVIGFGTNEGAEKYYAGFQKRYEYILQNIKPNTKIIICGIARHTSPDPELQFINDAYVQYNHILYILSVKYNAVYIDIDGILSDEDFNADYLHFNASGNAKILSAIMEKI